MRRYSVLFDMINSEFNRVLVYADNTRQVRAIMRHQYGTSVRIRRIELEED